MFYYHSATQCDNTACNLMFGHLTLTLNRTQLLIIASVFMTGGRPLVVGAALTHKASFKNCSFLSCQMFEEIFEIYLKISL